MLLEGLYIPLTTPFHRDGRLNLPKLAANIARYSKTPAAGLILLGPQAEPTLVSDDETRELLRTAAESAAPEEVLLANISRDSVHTTLALAEYAANLRYDGLLLGLPSIFSRSSGEPHFDRLALAYFQTVADRSPLPIVLLTAPAQPIEFELALCLAAHPNVLGLYDAAREEDRPAQVRRLMEQTASVQRQSTVTPTFAGVTARMLHAAPSSATLIPSAALSATSASGAPGRTAFPSGLGFLKTRTKTTGFQILSGLSSHLLAALRAGASAIAPAFAACAPQGCYEIFAAWKDGDEPLADEKQDRIRRAAHLAEQVLGPAGLKFGCDLNGYFGGTPRPPLLLLTGAERESLEALMDGIRS